MSKHVNHSAPDTAVMSPMQRALATAETFTRAQVTDLMHLAMLHAEDEARWAYRAGEADGYAARVDQENLQWRVDSAVPVFSHGEWFKASNQLQARRDADTVGVHPWRGDYQGGGAPASYEIGPGGKQTPGWPATSPAYVTPAVSTRVRRVGRSIVWADA